MELQKTYETDTYLVHIHSSEQLKRLLVRFNKQVAIARIGAYTAGLVMKKDGVEIELVLVSFIGHETPYRHHLNKILKEIAEYSADQYGVTWWHTPRPELHVVT